MGIIAGAVHLPIHELDQKALGQAGIGRGFEALRVPWFDEDPLTLAIEAGLRLDPGAVDAVERVHLALDDPSDQPGLALTALDLEAELIEHAGPDAGLEALVAADGQRPALVLAGGQAIGGAGVALVLDPDQGIELAASGSSAGPGLEGSPATALRDLVERHGLAGDVLVPAGRLERKDDVGVPTVSALTRRVGGAGAAGGLLELVHHVSQAADGCQVASASRGQAILVELGEGQVPIAGLPAPSHATEAEAYQRLTSQAPEPWAQASQGAYVSAEAYEAEPQARYGARTVGPGEVVAVTTIAAGPPGEFIRQHDAAGPYDVAIVALDEPEGTRIIGQAAVPPGRLAIGDRVRPVLRRLFEMEGRWRYALKWWPEEMG